MTGRHTPIRPVTHRFRLGRAWITTILDGAHVREPLRPPFLLDHDDAALRRVAAAARLPWDRFENTYTPCVVDTGSDVVLFDTGFGAGGRASGAGQLRARLAGVGYQPEDITVLAFTHMHPDHIAGVMEGDHLAFPRARHMIGRVEFDAWASGQGIPENRAANREMFLALIAPLADRLTFLDDGDSIAEGITAEAAFGHSPGHMMFRVRSDGAEALIWGDVTNHYAFSLPLPEAPVGFDDNKSAAIATRRRVLSMVARDGTLVVGHHMPFPGVGHVAAQGDSFAWVPATYQLWI